MNLEPLSLLDYKEFTGRNWVAIILLWDDVDQGPEHCRTVFYERLKEARHERSKVV